MKGLVLVLFSFLLGASAYPSQVSGTFTGTISDGSKPLTLPPPPAPAYKQHSHKEEATKLTGGLELGVGSYVGAANVSAMSELGLLVDYSLSKQLSLEGRLAFSQFSISGPYYYSGWSGWHGDWDDWRRFYYPGYSVYEQTADYNQVDVTFGPNYRLLTSRLSPVVGAMVGYTHRYFTEPSYSSYYNNGFSGSTDAFEVGALLGLDWRISQNVSAGLNLRYMVPVAYTGSQYYYPGTGTPIEGLNYYVTSFNLKFSF